MKTDLRHPALSMMVVAAIALVSVVLLVSIARRTLAPTAMTMPAAGIAGTDTWCDQSKDGDCLPMLCAEGDRTIAVFYADWCGFCETYAQETLADKSVVDALRPYAKARIDIDAHGRLFDQTLAGGVPHTIFYGSGCEPVAVIEGYVDVEEFLDVLRQIP